MKQLQFKYKNDPETLNKEVMDLYKREKMSPASGCLSAIIQIVLLFSVFYLVKSPLTYMKKVDANIINQLESVVEQDENKTKSNYKEIAIINYMNKLQNQVSVSEDKNEDVRDSQLEDQQQLDIQKYFDDVYINMNFLGLDLSKVPTEDLTDFRVFIIPVLYVISSFISIRMSTNLTNKKKQENKTSNDEEINSEDPMEQANKNMSWIMPMMSISIALIAPLGLALYWLVNNVLMIFERLILNKIIKDDKEEAENNA